MEKIPTEITNKKIMDNNPYINLEYQNYLATWRMEYGSFTNDYLWSKKENELIDILNSSFEETILTEKAYFREKKLVELLSDTQK